jgi:hypothetical protein
LTGTVPASLAAVAQAALPGAPNIQYSGVMRELVSLALSGCFAASVTASYRFMLPAPGVPGAWAVPPWLIWTAVGSWVWSWLATVLPFGVRTLASQS